MAHLRRPVHLKAFPTSAMLAGGLASEGER